MTARLNRRVLAAGLLATIPAPAMFAAKPVEAGPVPAAAEAGAIQAGPVQAGRGGGERLSDHAAFWAGLPLPFTPHEAWGLLSTETQAEIAAAVIGQFLAEYIHGDSMAEADQFLDDALRCEASEVQSDLLNRMDDRLWALFPDLYGPDGDHPRGALDNGLVQPLPP